MARHADRHDRPLIGYIRVSTDKQGDSGLGLEAQKASIERYAQQHGQTVIELFTEVQSGTGRKARPKYHDALDAARRHRGTLIVAKLDRLGRKAADILALQDSGVEFVAVDNPNANRLTIGILAVVAEEEARLISERTRAALQAYKARGGTLGTPENLTPDVRRASNAKRAQEAAQRNRQATSLAVTLRDQGWALQAIADKLTADEFPTAKGGRWTPTAVSRLLRRHAASQRVQG